MNCTVVKFEPFDYNSEDELEIIVGYDDGENGTSFIDQLSASLADLKMLPDKLRRLDKI